MITQYGEPVPGDLVLMPSLEHLTDADRLLMFKADWYEHENVLLVSGSAIDWLSEDDPLDADIDLSTVEEINQVADGLKRWNPEDGFYHA